MENIDDLITEFFDYFETQFPDDKDYDYEQYLLQKDAMETDYQKC